MHMLSRRTFSREFKLAAIAELKKGRRLGEVARSLDLNPNVLYKWRKELERDPENAFAEKPELTPSARVAELERKIGRLAMENDFLKKALQRHEEIRLLRTATGGS